MTKSNVSIKMIRKIVIDGLSLCFLVTVLYSIHYWWEPFRRGFFCDDETLKYPYHEDTVTVEMLRLIELCPIIAFFFCEWILLRKDKDDLHCLGIRIPTWMRGFYCTSISFSIGVCFIELAAIIAKNTIGRPRPHFFEVCQPSIQCNSSEWRGRYVQPEDYECLGYNPDSLKFRDSTMSFLSGHSAAAAYSMIYLALYLEGRMVWKGTRILRHVLQFAAVMVSWYTALSRITDYKHHWSDVLAGYTLGFVFALVMWIWGTDQVKKNKNDLSLPQVQGITLISHRQDIVT